MGRESISQEGTPLEQVPSAPSAPPDPPLEEFAYLAIEPGQTALIWDFEKERYVRFAKPLVPVIRPWRFMPAVGGLIQ